mmetsp:Transcript_28835/g.28520  ORF Transcript_28835/g.28520 Transcript_28835/m.28520 type:complete len:167 (+) Transcript_28835:23-523(+)
MKSPTLFRTIFRGIRTNIPKTNHHIYDFEKVDPDNPKQLKVDEVFVEPNKTRVKSSSIAFMLYLVSGWLIYYGTRVAYDYDWDRYYHVYHPALMEYFDILTHYYTKKLNYLQDNLPDILAKYLPDTPQLPTIRRTRDLTRGTVDKMVESEGKLGERISEMFEEKPK